MRRKPTFLGVAAMSGALLVAAPACGGEQVAAPAKRFSLEARLTAGAAMPRPKETRGGEGLFTATLTPTAAGATLVWRLTFEQLTGSAVAAHIHKGRPGRAGPVLVPLCSPCRSGAHGTAKLSGQPARHAVLFGETYVNVHTKRNPDGEIRGQIPKVAPGF